MVLNALLVVVVLVCLFCHCKITAYVGDNKLILYILSYLEASAGPGCYGQNAGL